MIRLIPATAAILTLAACVPPPVEVGRALFNDACAVCHGRDAQGNGTLAGDLPKAVPDLTTLSARNGGVYPKGYVLATIDGLNRRDNPHSKMPEFGALLQEGLLVPVDTGDGRATPTPERLAALAAYVERLQK